MNIRCELKCTDGSIRQIRNTELLAEADVTVTLEPAAPSVAGRVMLVPTATLPKLKLPGLMEN